MFVIIFGFGSVILRILLWYAAITIILTLFILIIFSVPDIYFSGNEPANIIDFKNPRLLDFVVHISDNALTRILLDLFALEVNGYWLNYTKS